MTRLLIVGAGGFGREVLIYAREVQAKGGDFEIAGFLDCNPIALDGFDTNAPILGHEKNWPIGPDDLFVIAAGDPELRARLYESLTERGAKFRSIVHPLAWIAPSAKLGIGTIVAPFATVNADAVVGENVAINSHVGVGHDARIGRHSAISPFTVITGAAVVGEKTFIGSSCVIVPKKVVGRQTTVASGSVVHKNVPDNALAIGNPAVIHRNWRKPDR